MRLILVLVRMSYADPMEGQPYVGVLAAPRDRT